MSLFCPYTKSREKTKIISFDDLENLFYRESMTVINFHMPKKKKMSEQILFSSYNEIPYSNLKNLATGMGLKIIRINEKSKLQK